MELALASLVLHVFKHVSVLQQNDSVAERGRKAVVGHHEDGCPQFADGFFERVDDRSAGLAVQVSRRLVCQNHQRIVDQSSRHSGSLSFAARNLSRELAFDVIDAEKSQQLIG